MRIGRPWMLAMFGVPSLFLLAFFVAPFMTVVVASFLNASGQFSLHNYARALGDLYYWNTLFLTFRLALWVTLAALAIGYPLAYFMTKVVRSRLARRLMYAVVVTPLFTSNIVRSFGWMVLLAATASSTGHWSARGCPSGRSS